MIIRTAQIDDLPHIAQLSRIVQGLHADAMPELFKPPTESGHFCSWFSEKFDDAKAWIAVADVSGALVAYIYAKEVEKPDSWVSRSLKTFFLHHIVVEPRFENQGIGRALMAAMIQEGEARGLDHFELEVWNFNQKAQRFFSAYGFAPLSMKMNRTLSEHAIEYTR
ncbi:MAG: GNAT family N-acetyltransferase [Kiritimatiellae bacterium]|nr:GNAT family N-acetyltransferase [Kiritimatiellia bacterium]